MRTRLAVIGLSLFCSLATAQTSFDEHFSFAKQGKMGPREDRFAKLCGVERAASTVTYGRSVDEDWTFKRVSSVGHGRNDAEMDYLGNAEIWSVAGKPRLVTVWFLIMDTGNTSNEMFCLDGTGHVTARETLNAFEPVDGVGGGWRHLRVQTFAAAGKTSNIRNEFLDAHGEAIPAPKLKQEDLDEANVHVSPGLAREIIAKLGKRAK